jgi:hypothetical protein
LCFKDLITICFKKNHLKRDTQAFEK